MSLQKPPKNAILLGDGKWIEHVELAGRYESAVNIDLLIRDLEPMWSALETECVAGCCGLDAFDFSPDCIELAASKLNVSEICVNLVNLQSSLRLLGKGVLVSQRLNNYCDGVEFDALLNHLYGEFGRFST